MLHRKYIQASLIQQTLQEHFSDRKMDIYDIYSFFPEDSSIRDIHGLAPQKSFGFLSDYEFESILLNACCAIINPALFVKNRKTIEEPALFEMNQTSNIYIYRYFNYYQDIWHSHSFFEMFYVFRGCCSLLFQEKCVNLHCGDFFIIAPGTEHSMVSDKDNFILNISVRKSDFEAIFRAELARENSLAVFFRNILFHKAVQGYLLFHTGNDADLKYCLKNVTMESMIRDEYNFSLGNCWLNILLTHLIRYYYLSMEMEPPVYGSRFSHILKYIEQNYQSVTLDILAETFHYTKPYLCAMMKENTGKTFSQLVNLQKTHIAAKMLEEGHYSIEEIATWVGYSSSDLFSRTFKKIYGVTPSFYKTSQRNKPFG